MVERDKRARLGRLAGLPQSRALVAGGGALGRVPVTALRLHLLAALVCRA